jgi:3-oxoacyl-[acyl-carrier-protein] synthase-3
MGSRLAGVEVHLPQRCVGRAEVEALGIGRDDCAVVAVHQVSLPHLEVFADRAGVPRDRLVVTVDAHGNAASAGLPLQLVTARAQGRCGPGDLVALVGPAGGVSLGLGVVEL